MQYTAKTLYQQIAWSWNSLVARMTVLVVFIGLVSLLLHLTLVAAMMFSLSKDLVGNLASRVRYEKMLLQSAPITDRATLAAKFSQPGYRLERDDGARNAPQSTEPMLPMSLILASLRKEAGPDFWVTFDTTNPLISGDTIKFGFTLDEQSWGITYQPEKPIMAVLGTGIGWVLLVTAGVIASLVIGVRLVGQPLSHIAGQLNNQHGQLQPLNLPPSASGEIERLVSAFNALVAVNVQAEATKHQMLAGLSHDLRTPLTRLRLRVETTLNQDAADKMAGDLRALERIISQFMGYVRGESQAGMGEPWPLNEVVSRVVASYESQGISVTQVVQQNVDDYGVQRAIPDLAVQRALTNLIDNALCYGQTPVEVGLSGGNQKVTAQTRLTVWDHGIGMSTEDFELAKQPFVRLSAESQAVGHCGLGLAIVKQVADQTGALLELANDERGRFGIALVWPAPA